MAAILNDLQNLIESWHKVIALLLIFGGIILGWCYLALQSEASRLYGLGIMGAIVLSTSLLGMVLISYSVDLPQATDPKPVILLGDELRTSITISFIFVFFGLLAYGGSIQIPAGANCPCLQSITKSLLDIIG